MLDERLERGDVSGVRLLAAWLMLLSLRASAQGLAPPPDPPRWRLRAALTEGVGGASDAGGAVTMFATTLELGVRVWKPLSLTAAAQGILAGEEYTACGRDRRPNAVIGTGGLRVDFANGKSSSWLAPFLELHGGVGRQGVGRESNGVCAPPPVFGTGGVRLGIDVWLGKAAVTIVGTYDYLPTAAPFSVALGLSYVLY